MILLVRHSRLNCNAERSIQSSRKMKRTITEIIVEVEETIAVSRAKQNSKAAENETTSNEQSICSHCGQILPETKKLNSKNEE